jgi:hypothetical protein
MDLLIISYIKYLKHILLKNMTMLEAVCLSLLIIELIVLIVVAPWLKESWGQMIRYNSASNDLAQVILELFKKP